jgi:hypothetical protein
MSAGVGHVITSQVSEILQRLSDKIENNGTIAGGAMRDLLLDREPKDYDIFLFSKTYYDSLFNSPFDCFYNPKEVCDESETGETDRYGQNALGESGVRVANCTAYDRPVQLIYVPRTITPEKVIEQFDFTINMVAYYQDSIIFSPAAEEAIKERKLIFNSQHHVAFDASPQKIVQRLIRRAEYLSEKLNLELPMSTIQSIYDKYPYDMDLDFENRNF